MNSLVEFKNKNMEQGMSSRGPIYVCVYIYNILQNSYSVYMMCRKAIRLIHVLSPSSFEYHILQ